MVDRPILFSGPMVAALLAGRKTQTRRVVKPQPFANNAYHRWDVQASECAMRSTGDTVCFRFGVTAVDGEGGLTETIECPYGRPGDRLWVRETWRVGSFRQADGAYTNRMALDYAASPEVVRTPWLHPSAESWSKLVRQSMQDCAKAAESGSSDIWEDGDGWGWEHGRSPCRWRPSIHMPRWASRITLEITGIRCERLQDISEADAVAEGLARITKDGSLYKYGIPDRDGLPGNDDHGWHWQEWERDPRNAYHKLWEQINGPGSAVANPWVWAITFKRVENTNG